MVISSSGAIFTHFELNEFKNLTLNVNVKPNQFRQFSRRVNDENDAVLLIDEKNEAALAKGTPYHLRSFLRDQKGFSLLVME